MVRHWRRPHLVAEEPDSRQFFASCFGESSSELIVALDRTAGQPILSSLLSAVFGTLIAMISGTSAAYGLSRFGSGGNLPLALIQLRIFPPMAVMIPVMIMWAFLGLIDTWYGLALVYGIVTMPFAFWLMKTFFDDMPREIEDAALVEGCSRLRVFWKITLPMMRPALASSALFVFILNWSDYLIALLLTTRDWVTIPVYMASLSSSMTGQLYGAKAALGLIAAVPPVILGHRHPEAPGARPDIRSAQAMTVTALDTRGDATEHEDARDSRKLGFWLTLPAQLLVLFIAAFPILMQIYISLTDWSPLDGIAWWQAHELWNSFANYTDLLEDDRFLVGSRTHRAGDGDLCPHRIPARTGPGDPVRRQFPRSAVSLLGPAGSDDGCPCRRRLHVLSCCSSPVDRSMTSCPSSMDRRSGLPGFPIPILPCLQSSSPTSGNGRR